MDMTLVKSWDYSFADGSKAGYVSRYENSTGGKKVIPYFNPDGNGDFIAGFPDSLKNHRPIYGQVFGDSVIVVEGEKCADAVLQMGFSAVTCYCYYHLFDNDSL